jgi:tetratricopeptide (TPR) repeat protein
MNGLKFSKLVATLAIFVLGAFAVYNLPPVQERLGWRVAEFTARIKYALSPPEQIVFVPEEKDILATPTQPDNPFPSVTSTNTPSDKQSISSPTATATLEPIPASVQLDGIRQEYQTWNNCGPATLAMALSYWGWEGDQRPIAAFTKPNARDKNVMPYELTAYVEEKTAFEVVYRVGGEIELLKRFLAAELPVIVEKGFEGPDFAGWMGHYALVTGYDDSNRQFTLQDSYYGPDQVMGYEDLTSNWRAFNFTYLVVYPAERRAEVTAILGSQFDEGYNNRYAAQKAADEIYVLTGRDQFFAWFNRGTNLVQLQDYTGAAAAYDEAFALYPDIPEEERPWRMMWYQTGPYWAYYYTGRYQDVINLATTTLDAMSEPVLEESFYWRALAREVLGDTQGAVKDLQSALKVHPGFEPALTELEQLGVTP